MSLSVNFPHKLALLQVALRAKKLKINEHLQDLAEQSVISSLLVFLDSSDYRLPITKPRKIIGQYSMLGRTALYAKLAALQERGIIERNLGDTAIRFTEFGVSLLSGIEEKAEQKQEKAKPTFFRVGKFSFPKQVIPLLTRGLSEKQVLALMAEAKKANVMIQDQIQKLGKIIDRYDGKSLFLIFRNFLKNPEKYQKQPAQPKVEQDFTDHELNLLRRLANNDECILKPGERVTHQHGGWLFCSPDHHGGAPQPVTPALLAELYQRLATACQKAAQQFGEVRIEQAIGTLVWSGQEQDGRPVVYLNGEPERSIISSWGTVYGSLPAVCQHWSYLVEEVTVDPRQGQSFLRNGIRYLVERIEAGRATLWFNSTSRSGATFIPVDQLDDVSIQWL